MHFVNKAYAKKRGNIFHFICTLRITEQKLNLPSRLEEKSTWQETRQRIVVGFVGKTQSIVVGFVVKAQRIVVECLRLDSGLPIITADFAQSLQAPSLCQQLPAKFAGKFLLVVEGSRG